MMLDLVHLFFQRATYEQQVYNPKGKYATLPTRKTPRSKLLSTGRDFIIGFEGAFPEPMTPNPDLFNIPYLDIGTTIPGSLTIDEREPAKEFDDLINSNPSELYPLTYLPEGALRLPTLDDWEQASGVIEIECNTGRTGPAIIKVKACNLLPSSIYTVWEVGIVNPGVEDEETLYTHPSGGIGNVIRSNLNGYGALEYRTPWCPLRDCVAGESIDCQLYFSIFHHPDYIVWGGDFAGVSWKPYSYPAGVAGSNHLWFPIYGTYLQQPLNRWKRKCKKEGR
eukprot:827375_1